MLYGAAPAFSVALVTAGTVCRSPLWSDWLRVWLSIWSAIVLLQWRGNYVLPDGLIWHVCRVPLPKTEKSTDLGDYFSKWAKFSLKKINTEVRLLRVQGPYSRRHRKIIFDRTMSLVFTSNHLKFYLKTVWLFKTICDSRQPSSEILLFTQMYILRIFWIFYSHSRV